jgi:hypothetical protein
MNYKTSYDRALLLSYGERHVGRKPTWREWIAEKILRVRVERLPDYFNHAQETAAHMVESGDKVRKDTFYTVGGKMEIEFRFVEDK